MTAVFVHGGELDTGGYPTECPFNSRRAGRTLETVRSMGMLDSADRRVLAPAPAARAVLEAFHTAEYLDRLERAGRGALTPDEALQAGLGTPDCPIFKDMYAFLALAAGASLTGAEAILSGEAQVAFNPSGGFHHAQPDHAAGFCYLNDVVLAALAFRRAGKRVAFLDIDVHHADGVQDAFYARDDVLVLSMHESGDTLFPGTGRVDEIGDGPGRGYTVNLPLPVGTYDAAYERVFRAVCLPLLRQYAPDAIILEIGMDGLAGDPLAHLHLTNNVYADIVQTVVDLGKPVLATGGGGYHIENTVRGWALCWSVLCGQQAQHDDLMIGMGGVMLGNTEWSGGLRDRVLLSDAGRRGTVDAAVDRVIAAVRQHVFPIHGLAAE
jgi:acetoin utilization protein AcuC